MINDLTFDFRFLSSQKKIEAFERIMEAMTPDDLRKILLAAEKLEIEDYKTRPAVDVLYDIAGRLSVLEAEIVSPSSIMDKIKEFLESS